MILVPVKNLGECQAAPGASARSIHANRTRPRHAGGCSRMRSPNPPPMMFLWSPAIPSRWSSPIITASQSSADDSNLSETAAIEMATRACESRGIQTTLVIPGRHPADRSRRHPRHLRQRAGEGHRAGSRRRSARDECRAPPSGRAFSAALRQRQFHAASDRGDCNSYDLCRAVASAHCARH